MIVVGGGLAGLSAAHTVLEQGGRVCLIDKASFFPAIQTFSIASDFMLQLVRPYLVACYSLPAKTLTAVMESHTCSPWPRRYAANREQTVFIESSPLRQLDTSFWAHKRRSPADEVPWW